MNIGNFIIGVIIFIFCIFLSIALPDIITTINAGAMQILTVVVLLVGLVAPFMGALSK